MNRSSTSSIVAIFISGLLVSLFIVAAAAAATINSHGGEDHEHYEYEQQQHQQQHEYHHHHHHHRQLNLNAARSSLVTKKASSSSWLTARSDCTLQVISYMQIPSEPRLSEPEEFVCELDPMDAPGRYSGLTRTLGLTESQKTIFKTMWAQGKLISGESKLMISQIMNSSSGGGGGLGGVVPMAAGGVGAVKFNSNMIQIPPELDLMDAVNWDGGGRSEVEQEDSAESDSSTTSSISLFDITTSSSSNTTIGDEEEYYTTTATTAETTTQIDNDHIDQQQQPSPSPTTTLPTNNLFQQHRKLQSFGKHTGPTPILVVKVTDKNGLAPDELTAEISDDVFGTTADTVNLKSQLHACSMGRLVVIPGDNNSGQINQSVYNAPGVMAVKLSISIETKTNAEIRNAITAEVEKELGIDLPGPYKHVMYVLKKCYNDCGWAAYAFVNGWNSVYVGDYCKYCICLQQYSRQLPGSRYLFRMMT